MADETAMTGGSDHFQKETFEVCKHKQEEVESENKSGAGRTPHDVPSCVMLSGTQIQTGAGWFVCIVVGEKTCEGQILAAIDDGGQEQTPLQKKLEVIAIDIGKLGMYAAILIFHCLLLRNFIEGMLFRKYDLFGGTLNGEGQICDPSELGDPEKCGGAILYYIKDYLHFLI